VFFIFPIRSSVEHNNKYRGRRGDNYSPRSNYSSSSVIRRTILFRYVAPIFVFVRYNGVIRRQSCCEGGPSLVRKYFRIRRPRYPNAGNFAFGVSVAAAGCTARRGNCAGVALIFNNNSPGPTNWRRSNNVPNFETNNFGIEQRNLFS